MAHDSGQAKDALDITTGFRHAIRQAENHPQEAWKELNRLAKRLKSSAPPFLPSFWEQAARDFVGLGSAQYASKAFLKARSEELAHALDIDENERRDAYLEFRLAGVVTPQALKKYSIELARSREPHEAYSHYRSLCLGSTLGGMPPWPGMSAELKQLAKNAGLDPVAEEQTVLLEMLDGAPRLPPPQKTAGRSTGVHSKRS